MLESDIERAQSHWLALSSASDLELAEAALSAELVELEALFVRSAAEPRVLLLLGESYARFAEGFIEARRLEALASGDPARARYETDRQEDARARARYYSGLAADRPARDRRAWDGRARDRRRAPAPPLRMRFAAVDAACKRRDRGAYERELIKLLAAPEVSVDSRLEVSLARRHAQARLSPALRALCGM